MHPWPSPASLLQRRRPGDKKVQRHPIKEDDILPGSLTAGVVAPPSLDGSSIKSGTIKSYFRVYGLSGGTIDLVPLFGVRVYSVVAYADGLPVAADSIFVQKVNQINGTTNNICVARASLAPIANEIARSQAVTNYVDINPWSGDFLRVDLSAWTAVPATVRIYFEAI